MPVSAISNIVFAIGITEFLACIMARKYIFQSESYTRTVEAFGRATWRRDKTAASLAIKQSNPKSQKAAEKEAKKLQREEEELSALAAEVARRHTMANFYPSIVYIILYRILATEYSAQVVALLPFQPFNMLKKMTFRGLSSALTVQEMHTLWLQSKGIDDATILTTDVSNASQACSFAFIFMLCSLSIKMMVNMVFGTKPPEGADNGVGTLMEAPQSKRMMKNFGVDADEIREARKAVGM